MESAAEMGAFIMGAWKEGGICAEVRNILHQGGSASSTLWYRVVGNVTMNWDGAGRISPSVHTTADGEDITEDLDIPYLVEGKVRGGLKSGGYLLLPHPEHCHTIYCNTVNC